jgi:hypothetical protein
MRNQAPEDFEEALDFPSMVIAPQGVAILSQILGAATVGSNHFDASLSQFLIQFV